MIASEFNALIQKVNTFIMPEDVFKISPGSTSRRAEKS